MTGSERTPAADAPWARTDILIGARGRARLAACHVLVVGLGGVGGFAAEALARAGIGTLTLVDHDVMAPSNLNRQLLALRSTLGHKKVDLMAARIADINPDCRVHAHDAFLTAEQAPILVRAGCDWILDAIDSLGSKVALLAAALDAGVPVASSMGAGGRLDPTRLRTGDLMDSSGCALAREVRRGLRRHGFERGVLAVWSDEPARPPGAPQPGGSERARAVNGTISYLPALFGLTLAGCLIQHLLASIPSPAGDEPR